MRLLGLVLLCGVAPLRAEALSADEIMQRVAANQDSAQELRSAYVYHQKVRVRALDSKGKVREEESSEHTALPGPQGTKKELVSVSGRYLSKGKYVSYEQNERESGMLAATLGGLRELRDELTNDAKGRDGLNNELFPLTSAEIAKYTFELKGEETWQHIRAYRIAFQPKPRHEFEVDTSECPWSGEALISVEEFQPIEVVTKLAHGVPLAVKVLLGTNIHGLGFTVRYQKVEGGAWFPASYGTEFSFRVLFAWARTITLALDNSGFQKADVNSTVKFAEAK
jgi:hypothetical protein